jgi:hypothetical protein
MTSWKPRSWTFIFGKNSVDNTRFLITQKRYNFYLTFSMILLFCVSKHQAIRYGTKLSLTGDIPGNYYGTYRIATHGAVVVTFQNLVSRTLVARCKNNQLLRDTVPYRKRTRTSTILNHFYPSVF